MPFPSGIQGEGFDLIIEDVLALPADRPLIVEGFRLLPHLVRRLLPSPTHAAWLIPTPAFRAAAFDHRRPSGPPWAFTEQTSDPRRALHNLLERDRMFTDRLAADASRLGLPTIGVDLPTDLDHIVERVNALFRL
jgi:hypothetical protein